MKKLLVILTVLLFIIGTVIFGVAASNDTASEQPTESARFGGASLLLENTVVIRYYVSLEGVSDPYGVSVLVWSEAQESYQKGGEKYSVPYEGRQKTATTGLKPIPKACSIIPAQAAAAGSGSLQCVSSPPVQVSMT